MSLIFLGLLQSSSKFVYLSQRVDAELRIFSMTTIGGGGRWRLVVSQITASLENIPLSVDFDA